MPTLNVDPGWVTHPKTLKLIRLAGHEAAFCLLALWSHALEKHPDTGDLSGYDPDDIEAVAGWKGKRGAFYQALIDCRVGGEFGYLEPSGQLHDWLEHEKHLLMYRQKAKLMNDAKRSKSTTLSQASAQGSPLRSDPPSEQASQQGSAQASLPVTVTDSVPVTKAEGKNNGSTTGKERLRPLSGSPGGSPPVESEDGQTLDSRLRGNDSGGDDGVVVGDNWNGKKGVLNDDDKEFQPLRVEAFERYLITRWPNWAVRRRKAFAGKVEQVLRQRGARLDPDACPVFLAGLFQRLEQPTPDAAYAWLAVVDQPGHEEELHELVKAARNGHDYAKRIAGGNGRGP